ncbi:HAD family hydrolase [Brotaphodocola sp.]|uniref:HAD family hydrolase n=1 Tax=Brotaphodocola sp. TaxID=3073577 RepID=UPI003D7CFA42
MKKQYLLFDLDGTLTDSARGIMNAIEYALHTYGITVSDRSTLRPFIGPPLAESMRKYYGFGVEQSLEAVERFREYYDGKGGLFENDVYEGIPELLDDLRSAGYHLYLATSKPEDTAKRILEHFDLARRFDFIGGATLDESREKKGDVIRYVLESCGIAESDKDQVVMIGDRSNDIVGAKENGLESIGVLYGYGSREELLTAGADYLAKTPADVMGIVSGKEGK